ncbi:unnamed protein product [Chondrus crispus]|uniref:Aminoglycoside phosphotransferase domain-containing protein n=1 Tax=Chondrus crispus TaxID=2769 RepID=R7QEP7_CHOCR|nr:unnamed protein product [Chondrus crispus]CDF36534.1 unnamed protein product [Chondrus crispus]|eukprot:XP_005716353.1 unnamed protein product [Chondrus crispus]
MVPSLAILHSTNVTQKDLVNEVQLLIFDVSHRYVLLVANGPDEWRLPGFLSKTVSITPIPEVCSAAKTVIGIEFPFIVLRDCYREEWDVETDDCSDSGSRGILVVVCHEKPERVPSGCSWVGITDNHGAGVVHVSHSEKGAEQAIRRELEQAAANVSPPRRLPWASVEWHHETLRKVREILHGHNLHVIGDLVQLRASYRGAVLKIKTNEGDYYLKCSPSTSNDAGVTSIMSSVAPDLVAKPLFADVESRQMILADHGDETGLYKMDDEERKQVVRDVVRLHRASTDVLPDLLQAGLPCYSPLWMRENLTSLFQSKELLSVRETEPSQKLSNTKIKLEEYLTELISWEMPDCLIHNDLYLGNLIRKSADEGPGFRFFDFDSSFASHPLFDVDWCNREVLEAYAQEMDIADIDGLYSLTKKVHDLSWLVRVYRYMDRAREAEDGAPREDVLYCLEESFHQTSLRVGRELARHHGSNSGDGRHEPCSSYRMNMVNNSTEEKSCAKARGRGLKLSWLEWRLHWTH